MMNLATSSLTLTEIHTILFTSNFFRPVSFQASAATRSFRLAFAVASAALPLVWRLVLSVIRVFALSASRRSSSSVSLTHTAHISQPTACLPPATGYPRVKPSHVRRVYCVLTTVLTHDPTIPPTPPPPPGVILILIFAEALGLYGLIVALILSQQSVDCS